ncbi:hypothetical protein [Salinispora cortesiana]|uniref:hypothetical protein n=1 Tax=Salinispora cortesiana TaxID=1305843 RepID=UPI0004708BC6|nr:hypothetical protein [Salinispora cortesiana]
MRKRLISRNRRPFQCAVVFTSPMCGTMMLVLGAPPTMGVAMPEPIRIGWQLGLVVAGLIGIAGLLWPGRHATGLGLELASMLMLGAVTSMYAITLGVGGGLAAVTSVSFITAVAFGSWWRGGELLHDLHRLVEPQRPAPDLAGEFP